MENNAGKIEDAAAIRNFVFGGRARFTVVSRATGTRFTFRVGAAKDGSIHFASLLTGADNEADYSYIGLAKETGLVWTGKSKASKEAPSFRALDWVLRNLSNGAKLLAGIEFFHDGACGRCGRALTVPSSVASGLGPECIKKI
jgi:hypothetical protein